MDITDPILSCGNVFIQLETKFNFSIYALDKSYKGKMGSTN
jgi:hypothetical protein